MKFLEKLRDWENVEEYHAQTVIFSAGVPTDVVCVIISGEIELTLHGELLSTEGPGGIIGELAMTQSATQGSSATTLTEVKLARFERDQFEEFVRENSDFSLHVMTILANRLRAVDQFITTRFE